MTRRRWMAAAAAAAAAVAVAVAAALAAFGGDGDGEVAGPDEVDGGEPANYVGEVAGTDFFVGVARGRDGELLAYACDGATAGHWFRGTFDGNAATAESDSGATLEVRLDGDTATGALTIDGSAHAFTAGLADESPGLVRAEAHSEAGTRFLAGWIVLPDGRQKGLLTMTSVTTATSRTEPAVVPAPRLSDDSLDATDDDAGEEEELQALERADLEALALPQELALGPPPDLPDFDDCTVFGICSPPDEFGDLLAWRQLCLDGVTTPPPDFAADPSNGSWDEFCASV